MKKIILVLALLLLVIGCTKIPKEISEEEQEESEVSKEIPEDASTLSELQVAACDAADEAGTCTTRLVELGIVLNEECCQFLGKCC